MTRLLGLATRPALATRLGLAACLALSVSWTVAAPADAQTQSESDGDGSAETGSDDRALRDEAPEDADADDADADLAADDADEADADEADADEADADEAGDAEADADEADADEADAEPDDASEGAEPARRRPPEPDLQPSQGGSTESGILGVVTIVSAVGAVASLAYWLERSNSVDVCETFEAEPRATAGCVNLPTVREQRDISGGFAIGLGALAVGAAIGWAITASTDSDAASPEQAELQCGVGLASVGCRGRF